MELTKRLAKAKTGLILEHPFVGSIALNMPFRLDDSIPTAATNGKEVIFNPEFTDGLTDEELKFVVAHECLHPMLEHNYRRGERDPRVWNQAGDFVINKLLTDEGIGKMPDMGLLDDTIYNNGGGTTDGIYKYIYEQNKGGDGNGGVGGIGDPLDDCQDGEGSPAEMEQQAAEWKVRVAQAAQAAKMMGKMSEQLERLVNEVLQPKVDWRDVLRRFVERCKDDTRTWARPNRRFLAQDMYLPSVSGEAMGEMVVAVDCSGSISDHDIAQFAAEITRIHEDNRPRAIHVIYFDSKVSHYDKYEVDDTIDIKPHGGGGTAFSPVFKFVSEHNIDPVACVFLTDLCCSDFGDTPDYPVLWVSNYESTAPFGEVVMM